MVFWWWKNKKVPRILYRGVKISDEGYEKLKNGYRIKLKNKFYSSWTNKLSVSKRFADGSYSKKRGIVIKCDPTNEEVVINFNILLKQVFGKLDFTGLSVEQENEIILRNSESLLTVLPENVVYYNDIDRIKYKNSKKEDTHMKYIKVNIQELLAALKPSEFRPFIKEAVLKKEYKRYLDHIFKGKDRIYIPFEHKEEIKVPKSINNVVTSKGYTIEDYIAGLAKNSKGRLIKIGKLLSQEENSKELLDEFNTSRTNVKNKEVQIVISRHPYDLAGMSTGRGWTSCMNLKESNSLYIHRDIKYGTLIAYLIEKDDINIKHPISRLSIKQYINTKNPTDLILYPDNKIYPQNIKGFREAIIEWLETFQTLKGTYYRNPKLYIDEEQGPPAVGDGEKWNDNIDIQALYYKNHPEDKGAKFSDHYEIRYDYYYKNNPEDFDYLKDDYFMMYLKNSELLDENGRIIKV